MSGRMHALIERLSYDVYDAEGRGLLARMEALDDACREALDAGMPKCDVDEAVEAGRSRFEAHARRRLGL